MPYFSFIMVCYNNWHLSQQAITSLIKSLGASYKSKGIELIIVDNGSTDETSVAIEELIKMYTPGPIEIINIRLNENMGYTIGLNVGLAESRGNTITVMNNDLIFPEGWFDGIAKILQNDYSVGVAVPFLSYATGSQNVGVRFDSIQEIENFARKFEEIQKFILANKQSK